MKKLLILFCIIVFASSCEDTPEKPRNTSDRMYGLGITALEIIDDFLDGNADISTTLVLYRYKYQEIDEQAENGRKETGSETLVGTEYSNDGLIRSWAAVLEYSLSERSKNLFGPNSKTGTDSELTELRNKLAIRLGVSER